jgi:hypothetical protein
MTTPNNIPGIDLAKGGFQACAIGPDGAVLYNRVLSRTPFGGASGGAIILHRGDGSLRQVTLLGPGGTVPWPRGAPGAGGFCEAIRQTAEKRQGGR